ncbi:MAG: hypothetical protein NTX24_01420 [Candidatus Pacearchaeota archaeon]|nr:hypothetical protein [Candidatus Pacearchaeota archaeon]
MTELITEGTIIRRAYDIIRRNAPFDQVLEAFGKENVTLASEQDVAFARRRGLCSDGSYVASGFEYKAGAKPLWTRNSTLSKNAQLAKEAVQANALGKYLSTSDTKIYDEHLNVAEQEQKQGKSPEERSVLILPERDKFVISPTQNQETFDGILGSEGAKYLDHLKRNGLTVYPVDKNIVDAQVGTILTQSWFRSLGRESVLVGYGRSLDCGSAVRGVRPSAEGIAKIFGDPVKVKNYVALLQGVRTGERPASELEALIKEFS